MQLHLDLPPKKKKKKLPDHNDQMPISLRWFMQQIKCSIAAIDYIVPVVIGDEHMFVNFVFLTT